MRAKPIKCYVGYYDGQRHGMIVATSKREAAKVAGCSVYHFEQYWWTSGARAAWLEMNPKALTLYTRAMNRIGSAWYEGICPL